MKSFGSYVPPESVGTAFTRLAIPRGKTFPHGSVPGEVFYLEADVDGKVDRPSYIKGLYISSGYEWTLFSKQFGKKIASPIGSQNFEIEVPWKTRNAPKAADGFTITAATIIPENRLSSISGVASFWGALDLDGFILMTVWEQERLVSLVLEQMTAKMPRSFSVTFMDQPASTSRATYTLKVNTNVTGFLYVNQSPQFIFDGLSQSALIISENN